MTIACTEEELELVLEALGRAMLADSEMAVEANTLTRRKRFAKRAGEFSELYERLLDIPEEG